MGIALAAMVVHFVSLEVLAILDQQFDWLGVSHSLLNRFPQNRQCELPAVDRDQLRGRRYSSLRRRPAHRNIRNPAFVLYLQTDRVTQIGKLIRILGGL